MTIQKPERGGSAFAADYLKVSPSKLEKLRCYGGGPKFYKIGRRIVYDRQDLDIWLEPLKRRSTSDQGDSHNPKPTA